MLSGLASPFSDISYEAFGPVSEGIELIEGDGFNIGDFTRPASVTFAGGSLTHDGSATGNVSFRDGSTEGKDYKISFSIDQIAASATVQIRLGGSGTIIYTATTVGPHTVTQVAEAGGVLRFTIANTGGGNTVLSSPSIIDLS